MPRYEDEYVPTEAEDQELVLEAKRRLAPVAICSLVYSLLAVMASAIYLGTMVIGVGLILFAPLPANQQPQDYFTLFFGIAIHFFGFLCALVMTYGCVAMLRLRNYNFAMTGAILLLVPVGCPCFSIPFGVWALVLLTNSNIQQGFQANKRLERELQEMDRTAMEE